MSDILIQLKTIVDKAISDLNKAENAVSGVDKATSGASKSSSGWALTMTGVASAINVATQVINALSQAYDTVITKTVDYAMSVDELSRNLGINAEEASTLIQITDDVFIAQEAMETGMRRAIMNGIDPSIEGLKDLADQYNAIEDPIQRSQLLLETFGRAGLEMGKLLEKGSAGIDEMAQSAAESGLIMDAESVSGAVEYKQALDRLDDAVTSIVYNLGSQLLPVLVDILIPIAEAIELTTKHRIAQEELIDTLVKESTSYEEFIALVEENAEALGFVTDEQAGYTQEISLATAAKARFSEETYNSIAAEQESAASTERAKNVSEEYTTALENLTTAQQELEAAQQSWLEKTANEVVSALGAAGVEGQAYYDALAAIDEVMGTQEVAEQQHKDTVDAITKAYGETGSIDDFKLALQGLKDSELPQTTEKLEEAKLALDNVKTSYDELARLAEEPIEIIVNVTTNDSSGALGTVTP